MEQIFLPSFAKRQSELCLLYRKWIQLCTGKHSTTKLQWPWGSSSSSLGAEVDGGEMRLSVSLWCHFSRLVDRKLSDFMAGHLQETSKSFSFPLPRLVQLLSHSSCSGSRWGTFFFWEQPLANCNSESKGGHHAGALHGICPRGTQKWCWAQVKLSSTLLQHDLSGCSNSGPWQHFQHFFLLDLLQ